MKWFVVEVMDRLFITRVDYVRVEANSANEAAQIVRGRLSDGRYVNAVYKEMRWK